MNDRETVARILRRCTKARVIEFALDYRESYFAMIAKYEKKYSLKWEAIENKAAKRKKGN